MRLLEFNFKTMYSAMHFEINIIGFKKILKYNKT